MRVSHDISSPQVCAGSPQCRGRHPQSPVCGVGVDSAPGGLQTGFQGVGGTSGRPVCDSPVSSTAPVCVSLARSTSLEGGRVLFPVGGVGPVRVSSLCPVTKSSHKDQGDHVCEGDTHSSKVDSGRLVPSSIPSAGGQPSRAASVGLPASSASSPPLSQVSRGTPSSRLETLQCLFRARGFSRKAARLMSQPVRASSSRVYQAKWSVYCRWCESRGSDPCSTSVTDLADFFLFLWTNKRLSLPSIRGYRSALAPVLRQAGLDISTDKDLSDLFRGLANSTPSRPQRLPAWDVSLVLRSLLRPPYEPLRSASLRDVTLKTAFLLALASARRVSELHALTAEVRHSKGWASMSFSLAPEFLAKTH